LLRQCLVAAFFFILMRRVSPAEFGLVGIANIWNTFFYLFLELGFAASLVQRKEISRAHIAAAFALNIAVGVVLMFASILASGPVSLMLNAPDARLVIVTVSISFFTTAAMAAPLALAQRDLRFKELAVRDFAANAIAAAAGMALAWMNFGVWAVVANSLLLNILNLVFIWQMTRCEINLRDLTREALRELWAYGSRVTAYTGLKYLLRTADSIFVGILFGPEKLGLYNFAQRITSAPTKALQVGLGAFLFPKAARSQDSRGDLKEIFLQSFKTLNYLLPLFSALLVTVGFELILILFGRQWQAAAEIIRILIFLQLLAPAIVPLAELLKAANKPNWLLAWTITLTALTAAALTAGRRIGFQGGLLAMVAAWWCTVPFLAWMVHKITGLHWREFFQRAGASYILGAASACAIFAGWHLFARNLSLLIISTSAVGIAHLLIAAWIDPDLRRYRKSRAR
jgi:O-antigen/teichoic acid export membrane protein